MSTPIDVVSAGLTAAEPDPIARSRIDKETPEAKEVARQWKEYDTAQAFDRNARKQYERDRRYAAGTADVTYAVDANLLGSYIDILVSYIYARDPKVSARPTEQVEIKYDPPLDPANPMAAIERYQASEARRKRNAERHAFAKTMQIVVSRLWLQGKLKKCMHKVVRAGYSVAVGWFKAALLFDTKTDPQVQTAINDLRDNMQRVLAIQKRLAAAGVELDEDAPVDGEERVTLETELKRQMQGLEAQVEIVLRKAMAIDFVSSEHMQVSLDVRDIDDYLEASWNANAIFLKLDDAKARFPDVTEAEWKLATKYHQREPTDYTGIKGLGAEGFEADPKGEAHQYTKAVDGVSSSSLATTSAGGQPVEFVKVVELWDKRNNLIKTMIEGLVRYAKEPFAPQFATSRFYPYFQVQFFPVDGDRHPQSLSWRLSKLADEYANSRSSFRLTRQRSIPGIIFNASQIDADEAKKLQSSTHGELIAITLTEPERSVSDAFAAKPISKLDPMLFDNALIIGDMEKISGVQEALQTSQTVDKTATQAEIEQGGFAARTTAARDRVEDALTELAQYTAELALQGITPQEAQQIAGPLAFWPSGMAIESITHYLSIQIEAGSTGRPNTSAEREAWVNVLPVMQGLIGLIIQARATNNEPVAQVYVELLRETAARFDDRIDVDRFIPALPPMLAVGAPGLAPNAQPGQPGAGGPGAPGASNQPAGAPPSGPNAPGTTDPLAAAA
jgi:hypothetical protein